MAISTPAQKPRGRASRTFSTSILARVPASALTLASMSSPRVGSVAPGLPAERAGLRPGDELLTLNREGPRDVIRYRVRAYEATVDLDVRRGGLERVVRVEKRAGEPLGAEVHSALFDRVRTGNNHCPFCFLYQLPKGMRKSLYVKDDDYRLSFLYGNFTTLTRFTEADLERVIDEGLGPLYVSIHATDPELRTRLRVRAPHAPPRRRAPRSGRRLPGPQRRPGARRHVPRRARPLPRA